MSMAKCVSVVIAVAVACLTACSESKQLTPTKDRPEWVDKGGGFFTGDYGRAFYGVGAATNISSPALSRRAADVQARADIGRVFESRVSNLAKIYGRSVSGGGNAAEARESSEQIVQDVTKEFGAWDLSGVQIVDHYYDKTERTQYSLAVLDLAAFGDKVSQMRSLGTQLQETILDNARRAFEELDREELKSAAE